MLNKLVSIPGVSTVVYDTNGFYEVYRDDKNGVIYIEREDTYRWSWIAHDIAGNLLDGGYSHTPEDLLAVVERCIDRY